jgi:predicted HD phosphohydrolase
MRVVTIDSVEQLLALLAGGYRRRDELDPRGEAVDQLTHALQAAHEAYLVRPADEELQVAALVHDLGHLIDPPDDDSERRARETSHAVIGASAVRGLLGERVADLVALHVAAKRYLVTTDLGYRDLLSTASARSLMLQGGSMTSVELVEFERRRHSVDAVVLRHADDAAKVPGRQVPSLLSWRPVLDAVANSVRRDRQRRPVANVA